MTDTVIDDTGALATYVLHTVRGSVLKSYLVFRLLLNHLHVRDLYELTKCDFATLTSHLEPVARILSRDRTIMLVSLE